MRKTQSSIERYILQREPFKTNDRMRQDAALKEREDALHNGDNDEMTDSDTIPTEQRIAAIREKILQQDHGAYASDNTSIGDK